ncbi:MAG: hypothetical protein JSV51_00820 [Candidatus Bathyarchaeota archaeon]|nr:MAG: hypothetical protein JSV51_00820 [Candidatus Bathyarchaeota archaeon]
MEETCQYEGALVNPVSQDRPLGEFDSIFAEAVSEGMYWLSNIIAQVLGIFLKDATTPQDGWMKSKMSVKDAVALEKGLEKIFGFGAKPFEKRILDLLYAKLHLKEQTPQDFQFSAEVKRARELYISRLRRLEGNE